MPSKYKNQTPQAKRDANTKKEPPPGSVDSIRLFCYRLGLLSIAFALFICLQSFLKFQSNSMEIRAYPSSESVLERLSDSQISWQAISVPFLSIVSAWLVILPKYVGRSEDQRQLPPRLEDLRNRSRRYEIG